MIRDLSLDEMHSLVTHPSIWPYIIDDGSPPVETYKVPEGPVYLGSPDFFAAFLPLTTGVWEVHIGAKGGARGMASILLHEALLEMGKRGARKILGHVPAYNQAALKCFLRAGMVQEGIRTKSFLRQGRMHDQICLGFIS